MNMIRIKFFHLSIMLNGLVACAQSKDFGPGYRFELFKNTLNWDLAKAVERQDTSEITKLIKSGKCNVDLREPKFGNTLLLLAVGNDKFLSAKALLQNGANVNKRDSMGRSAIIEATRFIYLKQNTLETLKQLLDYGGSANDSIIQVKNRDTIDYYAVLQGATSDLECTKVLIEHGGNLYINYDNSFPVWIHMLVTAYDDNIFVAKYLIIDKKMPIPNPIAFSVSKKEPQDIYHFLEFYNPRTDTSKQKAFFHLYY